MVNNYLLVTSLTCKVAIFPFQYNLVEGVEDDARLVA